MTPIYGCVTCGTPRPHEMAWDWITTHRADGCLRALHGRIDNEGDEC